MRSSKNGSDDEFDEKLVFIKKTEQINQIKRSGIFWLVWWKVATDVETNWSLGKLNLG